MVADNDAGTISVFSQAGQNHGMRLLWVLIALCPALYITQEMVARLGAVTGSGHARLTLERFGKLWCGFSLADLLVLNLATLVTEFIGVALALSYLGLTKYASVPVAAALLIAVTVSGNFRFWERAMYLMIAADLALIPLALISRPHPAAITAGAHSDTARRHSHHDAVAARSARWHHDRARSAVLPTVQRRRQANHATVAQLRARRHRDRRAPLRARRRSGPDPQRDNTFRHSSQRPFHERRSRRPRHRSAPRPDRRRRIRDRAPERITPRRVRRLALGLLRDRGGLRHQALTAPHLARRPNIPRQLRDDHRARRRHRAPTAAPARNRDHARTSVRRDPAAQHARPPPDSLQRQATPGTAHQRALAQRRSRSSPSPSCSHSQHCSRSPPCSRT